LAFFVDAGAGVSTGVEGDGDGDGVGGGAEASVRAGAADGAKSSNAGSASVGAGSATMGSGKGGVGMRDTASDDSEDPAWRTATTRKARTISDTTPNAADTTAPDGARIAPLAGTERTCGSSLRVTLRSSGQWSGPGGDEAEGAEEDVARRGTVSASTVVATWAACQGIGASVPCCGRASTSVGSVFVAAMRSSASGVVAVGWNADGVVGWAACVTGAMPCMVVRGNPVAGVAGDGAAATSGDGRDSGARTTGAVARFSVVSRRSAL